MNEAEARNDDAGPSSVTFASGLSWTRVRLPRLLSRIGKAFYLAGALGALGMLFEIPTAFGFGSLISILAWPLFIVSYILSLTQTSFGGGLTASSTELVVLSGTRRTAIPIAEIAGVLVVERKVAGGIIPTLEIELTSGDRLTARSPDPDAPQAVARALGFGPGGKRNHASLAKPTHRLLHPLLGLIAYAGGIGAGLGIGEWVRQFPGLDFVVASYPLFTLLLYTLLRYLVRPPWVTVGDDGVVLKSLFRSHFVAARDIFFVSGGPDSPDGTLAIEERSGKRVAVGSLLLDKARLAAVSCLVAELASSSATTADRFSHYDRAGRALAAWRDHLARAMNDTSYRHNASTVDEAASVLRSPRATPEQRVGAALALRVAGQPRERIRVAVEGAADDRVREALEAVADADDDVVIEKALKRLQP